MTLTNPSGSSASSSDVETVTVALPLVGMVTVREPVAAPNLPHWSTVSLTVSGCDGAGSADTVNEASPPSVTPLPAVTLTTGPPHGGTLSRHAIASANGVQRASSSAQNRTSTANAGVSLVPGAGDSAIHTFRQR